MKQTESSFNMKAMILAAGRGERMRPLTDHTPKPLLPAGGQPLIVWHLQRLRAAGIVDIVINHAWLGQQIEQTLGNGQAHGVNIAYSPEGETGLETAGGITTALDLLGDEPFLVINGDVLTDVDFQAACKQVSQLNNDLAHIWLVPNPPHNTKGDFALTPQNRVLAEPSPHANNGTFSGIGIYRPELFENIPKHTPAKLAPLLRQAMNDGRVGGQFHTGLWLDVGTPERLAQADELAKSGRLL